MDFETNRKYYDPNHRRKVKIYQNIGLPLLLVGAIVLAIASITGMMWRLGSICLIPILIGGPLWAVSLSMKVKEVDMLDLVDNCKRDFKEYCEDKLNYPNDLSANALLLSGSEAGNDAQSNLLPPRKLKMGGKLYPTVTFSYIYIRRDRLTIYRRRISLCEDLCEDTVTELDFSEFNGAGVQNQGTFDAKAHAFCITKGDETVYSTPVFIDDYTQQAFAENILHTKDRRR